MKTAEDYVSRQPHNCDTNPMPIWGMGPDTKQVLIGEDEEFTAAFTEWQGQACQHDRIGIIKWVNGGGAVCYNWYCATCGTKISSNVPHELARGREEKAHRDAMSSRSHAYSAKRLEVLRELKDAAAERLQPKRRAEYADYRDTDRWKELSAKVLKRAGGTCEGCLDEPAILAHHKTYAHLGHEFAFELLALCEECHTRFHEA